MSKTTAVKWIVIALAGAGIVWVVLRPKGPVTQGERAPGFTLPEVPSGKLSLSQYRGKVVVLNFWATWCPPCVMETPSLEQFAEKMKHDGVVVIGVSVDKNGQKLRQFIKSFHISYPIARDPDRKLSHRYGTFKYPETYIIGRDGHLAEKIIGAALWTDPRMISFVKSLTGVTTEASR